MKDMWQDVRYGIRALVRARGFTLLAVLVLGLGIGASTTIFSAINGVLLRPLPYSDPARLVALRETNPRLTAPRAGTSAAAFAAWITLNRTFESLAAYRYWGFDLSGRGEPERVLGARVSPNLFSLLGVTALRGRTLVASDDSAGQPLVALVSEPFWRRRFGGDPDLLNQTIELNGQRHTVVGIVRHGFALPEAELWVPIRFAPYELAQPGDRPLSVIGRLQPRSTIAVARDDMRRIAHQLQQQSPAASAGWEVTVTPLRDEVSGPARTPLTLLFVATCAVLLVACANLANLLLARSTVRRREMAVRAALGAGRLRIARHLITESMLIVLAAGALGVFLASLGTNLLPHVGLGLLPPGSDIRVDPIVLGFVLLVSLTSGAGLGVIPALEAARLDLNWAIKAASFSGRGRWGGMAMRDVPVVGQVAVALLLLVGGGLLLRSFIRAQAVDLGFAPDNVLSMTVSLPGNRYPTDGQRAAFFDYLRQRVDGLPGVRAAGLVSHVPPAPGALRADFAIDGAPRAAAADAPTAQLVNVTPGYFEAMRITVRQGRSFVESDRGGSRLVAVVDEALARRFWPGADALGKRVRLGATIGADTARREIIGIVSSVRSSGPESDPAPTIYIPHAQTPWPTMNLVVRTDAEPTLLASGVIGEVRALDANQPVYNVRSLAQVVGRTLASRRLQTLLMTGFAVTAVLLALIGVYGMLSYAVAQRTRELGIRVALGAPRQQIVWHCLRRALTPVGAGLLIGTTAALVAAQFLRAVLFAVDPWDPVTFVGALLLLAGASLGACYAPAVRAANVDPLAALRQD